MLDLPAYLPPYRNVELYSIITVPNWCAQKDKSLQGTQVFIVAKPFISPSSPCLNQATLLIIYFDIELVIYSHTQSNVQNQYTNIMYCCYSMGFGTSI